MSAYIVDKTTIDLLITAGLTRSRFQSTMRWSILPPTESRRPDSLHGELDHGTADTIGSMLWLENYASVHHRYPQDGPDELPGPSDFEGEQTLTYQWQKIPGPLDPVVVLKSISCYVYQSCEHDGWHASQARAFCNVLKDRMINQLPGYDEAPWGLDDPDFFTRRSAHRPT